MATQLHIDGRYQVVEHHADGTAKTLCRDIGLGDGTRLVGTLNRLAEAARQPYDYALVLPTANTEKAEEEDA